MNRVVGVDVGGSGVRLALVDDEGRYGEVRRRVLTSRTPEAVVEAVAEAIAGLDAGRVGVAVPGFVRRGRVLGSPNFPGWDDVPLEAALERRLGVPVVLDNDANAAALGAWRSRGRCEELVLLTLGTGVGGGVVLGGQVLRGAAGTGAELGHLFAGGARPCGCGGRGCLETWCGTVGLIAAAAERGHHIGDGAQLIAHARAGEQWADQVLTEAAEALGRSLVTLVNLFAPDVVVIAGGLTAARTWLVRAEQIVAERGIRPSAAWVRVVWEGRADGFAIIGAAELVRSGRPGIPSPAVGG